MAEDPTLASDPASIVRSKSFVGILVLTAIVGVLASLAAWCFLQLIYYMQEWVFTDIPKEVGFDSTPLWWYLPVLAFAGVLTAAAIVRLPGTGGHLPADGLSAGMTKPIEVPGVVLAGLASIGLGLVLGPEAPLIAIGSGLGILFVRTVRSDAPPQVGMLVGSSGMFAALSFLFGSPVIAAVILLEAAGLDKQRMPLVLIPGLLAAGIGSLTSIGMGSLTGLDSSNVALSTLDLPAFARPGMVDFLWTIVLAVVVVLVVLPIFRFAREVARAAVARPFLTLPAVGLAVAGLGILFAEATDKSISFVLFSGENSLEALIADGGSWSLWIVVLLIVCKGIAYSLSLGSFRGGPVFPAMFLGIAAGIIAAELPGFDLTPAVAVGIGAAIVAILRLPLAAVVLATLLTVGSGAGVEPLIIVGVVAAYLTANLIAPLDPATEPDEGDVAANPT